ncbi:MAG: thymidine phosphorylase [bacterium]|nr:thymidine phosphorylase [bacterium]
MSFVEIIARKRDGRKLTKSDIAAFVEGASRATIPIEQLASLLMAICCRGMDDEETGLLTEAMLNSGELWRLREDQPQVIDKHSTGGVGDTVSLVFAPLVASLGVPVAMMAGRGLGHTQGTLDKLNAIPGFSCERDRSGTLELVDRCGAAIVAQTQDVVPADRALYALRDVTGTVPSLPLIVSSIMSKKLALGASALVLDVKWGRGAFRKTVSDAVELAEALCAVGRGLGARTQALITDMNQPLGPALGTANEVHEALAVLDGVGDLRLREVTLRLAEEGLESVGWDRHEARRALENVLSDGTARSAWDRMVEAHGGNPDPKALAVPRAEFEVLSTDAGWIAQVDSEILGWVAVELGAGRRHRSELVDFSAGLKVRVHIGDRVEPGQILAVIQLGEREVDVEHVQQRVLAAFHLSEENTEQPKLVLKLSD